MNTKVLIGELLHVANCTCDGDMRLMSNALVNKLEKGFEYPLEQLFEFLNHAQYSMK